MRLPSMSVRPSVCQQDYSKTRAWIWMKFLRVDRCREHGRTDQLLNPIRIIVRMPEPENLKVEDLWTSVKQAPHSEQATGHGMHCRDILFTPRCSLRARESVRRTVAELRASNFPSFRILASVGGTCAPPSALLVIQYSAIYATISCQCRHIFLFHTLDVNEQAQNTHFYDNNKAVYMALFVKYIAVSESCLTAHQHTKSYLVQFMVYTSLLQIYTICA